MRSEWIRIRNDLENLEEVNLDIIDLFNISDKFNNLCLPKKEFEIEMFRLFELKSCFESGITLIRSQIKDEDNILIREVNEKYSSLDILESYFDNFLSILDSEVKNIQDFLIRTKGLTDDFGPIMIKSFREKLINNMENIILFPLKNAYKKFLKSPRKITIKKDNEVINIDSKELFEYLLFREIFLSAKIKGSSERQKISKSISTGSSTFNETNITKMPRSSKNYIQKNNFEESTPPDFDDLNDLFIENEDII